MVTRRTAQRHVLLRPDDATNNAFFYCLISAAKKFDITVLLPMVMSNHHHTVVYDPHGRVPEFEHYLHTLMARSQNMLRGRSENFWSSEETCRVELIDVNAVIDKLIYTAANPVSAGLVERAHHWPGVNEITAFLNQSELRATRPLHFFSDEGPMPDAVCNMRGAWRFMLPRMSEMPFTGSTAVGELGAALAGAVLGAGGGTSRGVAETSYSALLIAMPAPPSIAAWWTLE